MDKIKVSVIIPVYNVEKYLEECLDSIVNQTLRETEIICVNDGSTDGSPEILQKYAGQDERIVVCTQENRGQSAARNNGASRAQGKYLYFMDSDDILELSALEILYEKAEADNLDLLRLNARRFADDPKYEELVNLKSENLVHNFNYDGIYEGHALLSEMIRRDDYRNAPWLQLINRNYYVDNKLAFYEGIIYEDVLFSYECMIKAKRVEYLPLQLYRYRLRPNSTTTGAKTFASAYGYFICYQEMNRLYNEQNLSRHGDEMLFVPIKRSLANFYNRYEQLPSIEKQKVSTLPDDQRQLFEACVKNKRIWLPRKVRGGLICLRNNGFIYTVKLILWKIKYRK